MGLDCCLRFVAAQNTTAGVREERLRKPLHFMIIRKQKSRNR